MKKYNDLFIEKGFVFLGSGLIHNVYEKNQKIYKIVKSNIQNFNTSNHFDKEFNCLTFLLKQGINVVRPERIYKKGEFINDYCVLVEKKINGNCYSFDNISKKHVFLILEFVQKVANILVDDYGVIFDQDIQSADTWLDYLTSQIITAKKIVEKYFYNDIFLKEYLENFNYESIPNTESHFLIMDPNPENFIFDIENDNIVAIDIDHPIGGDRLWQSACFYWYREEWKDVMKTLGYFNNNNYNIVLFYSILFGLNNFDFFEKNSIEIDFWNYERIYHLKEELENEKNCR